MRNEILKIYVNQENFKIAKECGCKEITFYKRSDNLDVKKCDFVIFSDEQGNEVLRNLWEIKEDCIHYTTGWMGHSDNFPLIVIITNLYESIMHLRHETHTEKKLFTKTFAIDMIKKEVAITKLCVQLLEGNIDTASYIKKLYFLTSQLEDYPLESSCAILKEYSLMYKATLKSERAIDKIHTAIDEMEECLANPKNQDNISRIAYRIHNEPTTILESQ